MHTNRILPITLIVTATIIILIPLFVLAFRAFDGDTPARLDADGYPIGQPVTLAQLDAHAVAHLNYPGSHDYGRVGSNRYQQFTAGVGAAYTGDVRWSTAKDTAILAWYGQWLVAHGWQADFGAGLGTWKTWQEYIHGREYFQIAMDYPDMVMIDPPKGATVFEFRYGAG